MIVDCHTHWGMVWEEKAPSNPVEWLSILDRHQVQKAVFMGHANLTRPDLCVAENDNLVRMARRFPERLIPVGSCWPQQGKKGVGEARRLIETLRIKGLKFHPWLQGFTVADPFLGQMCGLAGEAEIPVFFHDGTPCYSLSEQIAGLARRFPGTRFVLAHSGLLWNWRSALLATRLPNIWLCLCGPHMRAIELLCRHADPDRILWGSDFGFGVSDQIEYRLNLFRRARISDPLREQILTKNPLHLWVS
jgi:predicted TIM-barrel fold metal-dependent hydrolase